MWLNRYSKMFVVFNKFLFLICVCMWDCVSELFLLFDLHDFVLGVLAVCFKVCSVWVCVWVIVCVCVCVWVCECVCVRLGMAVYLCGRLPGPPRYQHPPVHYNSPHHSPVRRRREGGRATNNRFTSSTWIRREGGQPSTDSLVQPG